MKSRPAGTSIHSGGKFPREPRMAYLSQTRREAARILADFLIGAHAQKQATRFCRPDRRGVSEADALFQPPQRGSATTTHEALAAGSATCNNRSASSSRPKSRSISTCASRLALTSAPWSPGTCFHIAIAFV